MTLRLRLTAALATLLSLSLVELDAQVRDPRSGFSAPGGTVTGGGGGETFTPILIEVDTVAELVAGIAEAKATGNKTISMAPGNYLIAAPLNLTECEHVTIFGNRAKIMPDVDDPKWANKFLVEMQGADRCQIRDLWINQPIATLANMPAGGLFLGRTTTHQSGGRHEFNSMLIDGNYNFASVVNVCSELNLFTTGEFRNTVINAAKPAYTFYISQPKPAALGGIGFGPINGATFSLTGPTGASLFVSTMSAASFQNCSFSRFFGTPPYATAAPHIDDAVIGFDNTAGGSFGNIRFESCWFNGNDPAANSNRTLCAESVLRVYGGDADADGGGPDVGGQTTQIWGLQFENCVSELTQFKSILFLEKAAAASGAVIASGLRMVNNHWRGAERIVVGGASTSFEGVVFADEAFTCEADYDWGYDANNVHSVASGATRCLYDFNWSGWNFVRCAADAVSMQWGNGTAYGVRGAGTDAGGGRTTTDPKAWSIARVRGAGSLTRQSTFAGRQLVDVLPKGIGGSVIERSDIRTTSAGENMERVFGTMGGEAAVQSFVVKRSAIASGAASPIFYVKCPAGNQSAFIPLVIGGHTDSFNSTQTTRGLMVINRQSGAACTRAYAAMGTQTKASTAGAPADALGLFTITDDAGTGTGAEQWFSVSLSCVTNGALPWSGYILVDCINASAGGITIHPTTLAGSTVVPLDALIRSESQPAPEP